MATFDDPQPEDMAEEVWITGTIDSMDKSTGSGYIDLDSGIGGGRVPYTIRRNRAAMYYNLFGHPGEVRVRCIVKTDEPLRPELDVIEMIPL